MPEPVYHMMTRLSTLSAPLPSGMSLGLVHVFWMLVSGQLHTTRGAVILVECVWVGVPGGAVACAVCSIGLETTSHYCGTARMSRDPATSVVDPTGKAHDLDNLYVADSSIVPASGATSPR
jgi:choline dehydrogenase-like flavoprotein